MEINSHKIELSEDQIKSLWIQFVRNSNEVEEQNFFFLHLMRSKENRNKNKQQFNFLNDKNVEDLLINYFSNEKEIKVESINNISYNFFKSLWISYHMTKGSLKKEGDKIYTLYEAKEGTLTLFDLAFFCKDKEVKEQAGLFLISVYSLVDKEFRQKMDCVARSFARFTLITAEKDKNNKENIRNAFKLIKAYISEYKK